MRSETESDGQTGRTFIEQARRRQIIAAAVEVIAEHGYVQASLARIAEHAGISKGVISYHFNGKEDLMRQLVIDLFVAGAEFMAERVDSQERPVERLRTYVRLNLEYIGIREQHIRAMTEVVTNLRDADGSMAFSGVGDEEMRAPVMEILRAGREAGEFADFDVEMLSCCIRDVIDGYAGRIMRRAEVDRERYVAEAVEAVDRMTARVPTSGA